MYLILLQLIEVTFSSKCSCNEIYFQDLCRDARGCYFEIKSGICEEIECIDRKSEECAYYAGKLRCYWDISVGFCKELSGCEELQSNDKVDSNEENCKEIDCRWDYQSKICLSEAQQRLCSDYNVTSCSGASQQIGMVKSVCVINGLEGDSCIAFEKCEDITYEPSCDKNLCKYEDGECLTKLCSDYSSEECPSFNSLSQQQCLPYSIMSEDQQENICQEFKCSEITSVINCQNHPRCFWSQNMHSCNSQSCNKATYPTQCLSFSYVVENAECKWENDSCKSCFSMIITISILIIISY